MKTILLPTDFSRNAWNAMFNTLKLFHRESCEFILLHAYQPEAGSLFEGATSQQLWEVYEALKEKSEGQLAEITTYLKREYHNTQHRFRTVSLQGDLLMVIRNVLEREAIDLIALGTQGATGAKRVFLGSNTVRVIKQVNNVPVLAVPNQFDLQQLDRVILPTDYMYPYLATTLQPALDLIRKWRSRLHVVYVANEPDLVPKQEEHLSQLQHLVKGLSVQFDQIALTGKISDALADYAQSLPANLIVLLRHKHGFFETLTREPVVKQMAYQSTGALLILPQSNK